MFYFDSEKGTYATVWKVEKNEKGFVKGRISTSEKNQDGEYINSNWFVSFGKDCGEKALKLNERDRILIHKASFKNPTIGEGENRKSYLNIAIYSFDVMGGNGSTDNSSSKQFAKSSGGFPPPSAPIKNTTPPPVDDDDSLPFDL